MVEKNHTENMERWLSIEKDWEKDLNEVLSVATEEDKLIFEQQREMYLNSLEKAQTPEAKEYIRSIFFMGYFAGNMVKTYQLQKRLQEAKRL